MSINYKNLFPFLFVLVVLSTGCNQNSLEFTHENEVVQIKSKIKLISDLRFSSPDSARLLATHTLRESEQLNYSAGMAECNRHLGIIAKFNGEYLDSYKYFERSLIEFKLLNDYPGITSVWNSLGNLYQEMGDFEEASEYYKMIIKNKSHLSDTSILAYVQLNFGNIYVQQKKPDKAITVYTHLITTFKQLADTLNLIACYINLGEAFEMKDSIQQAEYCFNKCENLLLDFYNPNYYMYTCFYLGRLLFKKGNFEEAIIKLDTANALATEMNLAEAQKDIYNVLAELHNQLGNTQEALDFLMQKNKIDQRLNEKEINKNIAKSKFEEHIRMTSQREKKKEVIIGITVGILLISLMFIFILYRNYRHKQKANRLLTEMDELKTRMFSDISHEMRTPLTLILGPLEQMLSDEAKKKPGKRQVKLMRKNANSILNLVNQMLDLSKIDAKNMKLELVEEDIVKFIRVRFASFYSLAEQKQIEFNCYLPNDKKIRFFDAEKLEKILNNLVSNAIKFTPEKGQVFCFASFPRSNKLELTIQDTGEGIPQKELFKIFDRFHQVNGENGYKNIGTGIGLALTKELVQLMHGQINVESIVGEGTKFKVEITLGKEHLNETEYSITKIKSKPETPASALTEDFTDSDPEIKNENTDLPVILVVDDHVEIRNFIKENLLENYTIETASNGLEGFELAVNSIPDLIITDLMMPEMDGNRMCKKLKQDERTSHIPIIILTAKSEEFEKLKSLETGADAFLSKPFNMKELKLRVQNIIEQRKKLRERFARNICLEPKEIAVASADEKFMNKAMEIIERNIGNSEFEVSQFQEEMFMSRMQLFRKIKALTNQSPGEFIRTIRLKRAASLMDQKFGNIAQITFEVGFNNPSYFAKCFKDLFGKLPSEYMKSNTN